MLVAKPGGGYGGTNDRYVDLRVDHHDQPIEELASLLAWHRLYFERPREEDLIPVDAALEDELGQMLAGLGRLTAGQDLWKALEEYVGWENLEERWARPGRLDAQVLAYLRRQASNG